MRFRDITPETNFNQIHIEFKYIIVHNIGKRFMGYICKVDGLTAKRIAAMKATVFL